MRDKRLTKFPRTVIRKKINVCDIYNIIFKIERLLWIFLFQLQRKVLVTLSSLPVLNAYFSSIISRVFLTTAAPIVNRRFVKLSYKVRPDKTVSAFTLFSAYFSRSYINTDRERERKGLIRRRQVQV